MFQPIVNLHGRTEEVYEVRVALRDENGSAYSSARAFELAESSGNATRPDSWVVEQVLAQVRRLNERARKVRFFIQLSASTICDERALLLLTKRIRADSLATGTLTI
jgi:multidomain signaling protein FimX